jgi:hypothetical protein
MTSYDMMQCKDCTTGSGGRGHTLAYSWIRGFHGRGSSCGFGGGTGRFQGWGVGWFGWSKGWGETWIGWLGSRTH